ncbi:MAG: TRAP transporter substrate-binding protein [Fusobacteriaceae bacterium]|jgi:tripartite ATP-independent transporter DctP family solute receptor|nr:TRAP transporter substrate-binding protein [Fusobacteriaceae bacterium]
MKKVALLLKVILMGILLSGLVVQAKDYKFQLGYNTVEDSVRGEMAKTFKEYVEKESKGRISVELFAAGTLGSEQEMIEMVKIGVLDFSLPGCSSMSTVDPSFSGITLPFLVKNFDEGHKLQEGVLGERYKEIAKKFGYKIIGWGDLGMAQITNNKRAIESVADMRGLKMRSPNEGASIKTFESLGCSVTTLPFSELYLGMSQGVVDGQFNPIDAIYQQKFFEVQDYLAVVNVFYYAINFIMNDKKFESMDAETQKIILEGAAKAQEVSRAYAVNADSKYLEMMKNGFKKITHPDPAAFAEAAKPVYEIFYSGADEKVSAIIKEYKK